MGASKGLPPPRRPELLSLVPEMCFSDSTHDTSRAGPTDRRQSHSLKFLHAFDENLALTRISHRLTGESRGEKSGLTWPAGAEGGVKRSLSI